MLARWTCDGPRYTLVFADVCVWAGGRRDGLGWGVACEHDEHFARALHALTQTAWVHVPVFGCTHWMSVCSFTAGRELRAVEGQ